MSFDDLKVFDSTPKLWKGTLRSTDGHKIINFPSKERVEKWNVAIQMEVTWPDHILHLTMVWSQVLCFGCLGGAMTVEVDIAVTNF